MSVYAWRLVCDGSNCVRPHQPISLYRRKSDPLPPCPQQERPQPAAAEDDPNDPRAFGGPDIGFSDEPNETLNLFSDEERSDQ